MDKTKTTIYQTLPEFIRGLIRGLSLSLSLSPTGTHTLTHFHSDLAERQIVRSIEMVVMCVCVWGGVTEINRNGGGVCVCVCVGRGGGGGGGGVDKVPCLSLFFSIHPLDQSIVPSILRSILSNYLSSSLTLFLIHSYMRAHFTYIRWQW